MSVTLEESLGAWLEDIQRNKVTVQTYERYALTYRRVVKYLGFYRLEEIDTKMLQEYIFDMNDKGYTRSTMLKSLSLLKNYYKYMVSIRALTYNPVLSVEVPGEKYVKKKTKRVRALNMEERQAFFQEAFRISSKGKPIYRYAYLYLFMMCTGLRAGEVVALFKSDVDLDKREVHVNHSITMVNKYSFKDEVLENSAKTKYVMYLHDPKTEQSKRIVPLSDVAYEAACNVLKYACKPGSDLFVTNKKGGVLLTRNLYDNVRTIAEKAGIEPFGLHTFRHTFGSILSEQGVSDREIADLMGHTYITVTQKYIHKTEENLRCAVQKIDVTKDVLDERIN